MCRKLSCAALVLTVAALLAACSDQRVSFEINGNAHSLTLIRISGMPWEKTARYDIVASHMPECMRRHALGEAPRKVRTEVYSPGNDAWILKQGSGMFVVETRTCEGFARLDKAPADGLGTLMGAFEMRDDTLVFVAAPKAAAPAAN